MRARRTVTTAFGPAAYLETGSGEPAVFIHELFMGAGFWTGQLDALGDLRRCIALDLLGHGASPARADEPLTLELQARFAAEVLDALGLEHYHLVANDSGGAVAQLLAARAPRRVRSLTLTNCEVHTNCPPEAFLPFVEAARAGAIAPALAGFATDVAAARQAMATAVRDPGALPEALVRSFFEPFAAPVRAAAVEGYVAGMSSTACVAVEPQLRALDVPALIVWGLDDGFFDVSWAHWLAERLPGVTATIEVPGSRLFFPLEEPEVLTRPLRELWSTMDAAA